jgi:hypothetical protein
MASSAMGDVMSGMATVPHRAQGVRLVRCTVATFCPGFGVAGLYCSQALSRHVYVGANFEGARGRLLGPVFPGSRPLGVGPLHGRLLGSATSWQPVAWTSRSQEGGALSLMFEGRSQPRSLEIPRGADEATRGHLLRQPVLQGVKLSKTQSPTTTEARERMKVIPYASAIDSL